MNTLWVILVVLAVLLTCGTKEGYYLGGWPWGGRGRRYGGYGWRRWAPWRYHRGAYRGYYGMPYRYRKHHYSRPGYYGWW